MKTKIMAGIALTAIAATGVVGGFAIANGGLNSGIAATASDHSLTLNATVFGDYSDSSTTTTYYGWTISMLKAGLNTGKTAVIIVGNGSGTPSGLTFPTVNRTTYAGAYYKSISVSSITYGGTPTFKLIQVFGDSTPENSQNITTADYSFNFSSNVVAFRLENWATGNGNSVGFASVTVTYYC